jgi:hypothetical protein
MNMSAWEVREHGRLSRISGLKPGRLRVKALKDLFRRFVEEWINARVIAVCINEA